MDLTTDQVRLLMELGLVAVGEGRLEDAEAISDAVAAYRPHDAAVYVARALIEMRRGKPDQAVGLLEKEALARHPDDPLLQTFLGMALMTAGYETRAKALLEQMAAQTENEKAASLAYSLLHPEKGGKERT